MRRPEPGIALVFTVVCVISLAACSRSFIVKPVGHFGQTITFHFYESAKDKSPSKQRIVEFIVQEQKAEKEWIIVWALKGEQSLEAVVYGQVYEGLKETAPAKPLGLKAKYRVLATNLPRFEPVGYAAALFEFDESGGVVMTSRH